MPHEKKPLANEKPLAGKEPSANKEPLANKEKEPIEQDSLQIENAGLTFVIGFAALMLFQLFGEVSVRLLNVAMPGPVVGLVYMLIFLVLHQRFRGTEPMALTQVSSNLLAHLSLLFVPAGVGVMIHLDKIASQWQAVVIALLIGSVVTLGVTAWSLKFLIKLFKQVEPE